MKNNESLINERKQIDEGKENRGKSSTGNTSGGNKPKIGKLPQKIKRKVN